MTKRQLTLSKHGNCPTNQVVERLGVVVVHRDSHLESLVRKTQVADANGHVPDVVPVIGVALSL